MLTIREEQMTVLTQRRQDSVSVELAKYLRDNFKPTFQFYSQHQLNNWVSEQIDFLAERKVTGKETVVDFIELFAIFGANFERSAQPKQAIEILNHVDRSEELRLDNILKWAKKELK